MMTIAELLQELEQEAATTRRVLERVPEDRLDWRPHEKSMAMGELALHLAQLPGAIAELALVPEFDVNTAVPLPMPASVAEVVETHDRSVARAKAALGKLDDAALGLPWRMVSGEREIMSIPRSALLRTIMLNHSYHHRGQLTVYLRETGAQLPSVYGPSADERPFGL